MHDFPKNNKQAYIIAIPIDPCMHDVHDNTYNWYYTYMSIIDHSREKNINNAIIEHLLISGLN